MGIEPFLIASSVVCVIAQRLVRKLCPVCKKVYKPTSELLRRIGLSESAAKSIVFYEPVGCDQCLNTGYKGRLPIFEVMEMTEGVAKYAMERADTALIRRQAQKDGMSTLLDDGISKIKKGLTSIDEVLAVATMEETISE